MAERSVLVCEDNEHLREIFGIWLRERHTVRAVTTGDELLEALDPSVDVVVSDWRVRGTARGELLDAIDRSSATPGVVITSGTPPRADLESYGVEQFLEKPITKDALRNAVRSATEATRQIRT